MDKLPSSILWYPDFYAKQVEMRKVELAWHKYWVKNHNFYKRITRKHYWTNAGILEDWVNKHLEIQKERRFTFNKNFNAYLNGLEYHKKYLTFVEQYPFVFRTINEVEL